jgi:drug/metabolite transporter (DMT)-like permease
MVPGIKSSFILFPGLYQRQSIHIKSSHPLHWRSFGPEDTYYRPTKFQIEATPVRPDEQVEVQSEDDDDNSPSMKSILEDIDDIPKVTNELEMTTIMDTLTEEAPPLSIFLLNLVAIIWGSQHAVIKMVVDDSEAGLFTLLRFGLAALLASPYTPGLSEFFGENNQDASTLSENDAVTSKNETDILTAWRWGAEMGFWMFLGFSFQAIGLGSTTAQRSGFLLYLNVKFVPFFARILFGKQISIPTWVSAFAAFTGTALLALDGSTISFNVGDLWSIAAAMSSAMFILRLEAASKYVPNSAALNSACLWVVALLATVWSFGGASLASVNLDQTISQIRSIAVSHPAELIYLGGVTTALSNYIQAKAQKNVSAERASVIYSLDPVYGAIFAWLLLGEQLGGPQAYAGAALITIAAATNIFLDFGSSSNKDQKGKEEAVPAISEELR